MCLFYLLYLSALIECHSGEDSSGEWLKCNANVCASRPLLSSGLLGRCCDCEPVLFYFLSLLCDCDSLGPNGSIRLPLTHTHTCAHTHTRNHTHIPWLWHSSDEMGLFSSCLWSFFYFPSHNCVPSLSPFRVQSSLFLSLGSGKVPLECSFNLYLSARRPTVAQSLWALCVCNGKLLFWHCSTPLYTIVPYVLV